ncbi:MAG TPA: radical SAM protein [Magnetospirillaceae bacterium]|jgi:MoaA/NifB/PqqE/SkfB family radical SAM enzyme
MRHNKYSEYKIALFPEKLESFVKGEVTAPIYVRVKPTNVCNHNCFFCVYASGLHRDSVSDHIVSGMHEDIGHRDVIPTPKMMEILEDFRDIGVKAITYSGGGEPLMHKDIVKFMQTTLDYGIDLSIITNGQLLTKDRAEVLGRAKWVRVSMDYANAEEMVAQRGVSSSSFQSVINNIEQFAKVKKGADLGVNFIIHKKNVQSIFFIAKLLKDSGVENVRFSPMWIENFAEYHADIEDEVKSELERASTLIDSKFTMNTSYNISAKNNATERTYHQCFYMQIVPVVGADQMIYACHNKAYDNSGAIGSIRDKRFREVWFSDEVRRLFTEFDAMKRCHHQCANDGKNIFMHGLLDAQKDNFV